MSLFLPFQTLGYTAESFADVNSHSSKPWNAWLMLADICDKNICV